MKPITVYSLSAPSDSRSSHKQELTANTSFLIRHSEINVVRQLHPGRSNGNGEKEKKKKNLGIILCRFPPGAWAQSGVLTPNDKKHQAGCLASESHYELDPFLLPTFGCGFASTVMCVRPGWGGVGVSG